MEPSFNDDLQLLANSLRQETFRFILVGHNRYSLYKDIASWLYAKFPNRTFLELRLEGKDYRQLTNEIISFQKGIILIPDFDWLFREENAEVCVAFNQRRDAFARLDIALICFIEPSGFLKVPKKVPDWWSLRSLELDFYRETPDVGSEFLISESEKKSDDGQSKSAKEKEIQRILWQISEAEPTNKLLLIFLYSQLARLQYDLSFFKEARGNWEKSLELSQEIKNLSEEGKALNNLGQFYSEQGDNDQALSYLKPSLNLRRQIDDKFGEGITLNNIGQVYYKLGNCIKALWYFKDSIYIRRQIGDKAGEGVVLNNVGFTLKKAGKYARALKYLQDSLTIRREVGDKSGESDTLSNIGQIYYSQGNYEQALTEYFEPSLTILRQIGDKRREIGTLDSIGRTYFTLGKYVESLKCLEDILKIQLEMRDPIKGSNTLFNMGMIHFEHFQNPEKAIPLLLEAFNIQQRFELADINQTTGLMDKIHNQIGEARFNEILDSIKNNPPS